MITVYAALVTVTAAVHAAFMLYLVIGGFLAVRWRRTIWLHGLAALWGAAISELRFDCPLTRVEIWARARAQMAPLPPGGFIDHYFTGVLYPAGWEVAVALLIIGSWTCFAMTSRLLTVILARACGSVGNTPILGLRFRTLADTEGAQSIGVSRAPR